MINKGSIFGIEGKDVIVLTQSSDFISIRRQPGMVLGQEIEFCESDIIFENEYTVKKNKFNKYSILAAGVAAVLMLVFLYTSIFKGNEDIYAYVDIDINPSLELTVDKQSKVIDAVPLNDEAKALIKRSDLKDGTVNDAIEVIVKNAKELGYIDLNEKDQVVLVSASLNEEDNTNFGQDEQNFNTMLMGVKANVIKLDDKEIVPMVMKIPANIRKEAQNNSISMGKWALAVKANGLGKAMLVEVVKKTSIQDLIKDVQALEAEKNSLQNNNQLNNNEHGNQSKNDSGTTTAHGNNPVLTKATPVPARQDNNQVVNAIPTSPFEMIFTPVPIRNTPINTSDATSTESPAPVIIATPNNIQVPTSSENIPTREPVQHGYTPSVPSPAATVTPEPTKPVKSSPVLANTPIAISTEVPTLATVKGKATDVPYVPTLLSDNWDHDGEFTLTASVYHGNNATSWKVYENEVLIHEAPLSDNSPNEQIAALKLSNKPKGLYYYRCEFINSYGMSSSPTTSVVVN